MTTRGAPRGVFERALGFCRANKLLERGDRVLVASGSGVASLGALGFLRLAQQDLGIAEIAVGAVDLGDGQDAEAVADVGRFARILGVTFYAVSSEGRAPVKALGTVALREGFGRIALGH